MSQAPKVTTLLHAAGAGDENAKRQLYEVAYLELKRIARGALRRGAGGALNPTTLVHEAYMKIAQGNVGGLNDSTHFYSLFARAMRQVLLDVVRADGAIKRGADLRRVELDGRIPDQGRPIEELLQIDSALSVLEGIDPDLAQLVEWHFFAGLSFTDIAAARGVNERTVRRHWDMARALLLESMQAPGVAES